MSPGRKKVIRPSEWLRIRFDIPMNEIEFVYIRVPEEIILYADPAPLLIIEETQVLIHRPPLRMAQHDRFSLTLGFLSKGRDGEKTVSRGGRAGYSPDPAGQKRRRRSCAPSRLDTRTPRQCRSYRSTKTRGS